MIPVLHCRKSCFAGCSATTRRRCDDDDDGGPLAAAARCPHMCPHCGCPRCSLHVPSFPAPSSQLQPARCPHQAPLPSPSAPTRCLHQLPCPHQQCSLGCPLALSILGPRARTSSDLKGSKVLAKKVLERFVAANSSGTCRNVT